MYEWEATEATCSKIGTTAFHGRDAFDVEASLEGQEEGGTKCTGDEKSCARARAFNKVLRFFSCGKLVYGSSGMSNGCRRIACQFTHQANFPAYRGAIFLPLPHPSSRSIIALLLFHLYAPFSPRILHPVRFPSHHHLLSPGWKRAFLPEPEFGCLRCIVTWLLVSVVRHAPRSSFNARFE